MDVIKPGAESCDSKILRWRPPAYGLVKETWVCRLVTAKESYSRSCILNLSTAVILKGPWAGAKNLYFRGAVFFLCILASNCTMR